MVLHYDIIEQMSLDRVENYNISICIHDIYLYIYNKKIYKYKYNVTVSEFKTRISPRRSEEFVINRPFLYAIIVQRGDKTDNSNPLTLFSGRIFTPKSPK